MIIGLTGGIGSGKSTIAQALAQRGYAVYECDREAKRIIVEDAAVRRAIIDLLGTEAFTASPQHPFTGVYNTAYVAQRVFAEPALRAQLNAIVHPAVKDDICQRANQATDGEVLFIESAILYEAGLNALCDRVVVIDAPEDIRIARTIDRDYDGQATSENINKVRARISAQAQHTGDLLLINDGEVPIPDLVDKITLWMWKN
jgi:dephospho-CoA kinase